MENPLSREGDTAGSWVIRISAVTAVIGLEVATRMLSTTWTRLKEGVSAVRGGPDGLVANPDFLVGLGLTALATTMLVISVWRSWVRSGLAVASTECPECGEQTKRIRRKISHKLMSPFLGDDITRRACSSCGWVGLSKDL